MTNAVGEPRVVGAGRGARWWAEGFSLFRSGFWTWLGIVVIYVVISVLISQVPYVGSVGHWLLTPVFVGGLMLGCRALDRGEPLRVAHLFEGFQGAHFVPLMIIGVVNIGIVLAFAALAFLATLGSLKFSDLASMGAMSDPFAAFFGSARAAGGTAILMTVVALTITTAIAMLNWFAPALVALDGANAVDAMKASFVACLRNWLPFLVYGLIGVGVLLAAVLLFLVAALGLGAGALLNASDLGYLLVAAAMFVLPLLVMLAIVGLFLFPVALGSTYAGYKDTLAADDAALSYR